MEKWKRAFPIILLILVPTLIFSDVLFARTNFFVRDLYRYHFPLKFALREIVASGEFPYWNRAIAGGQPLAANPAYEVFYPPQLLIFIHPFDFGFALHILFHIYLALLGMYAFLRLVGVMPSAAFAAAMSFGMGGLLLGTMTNLEILFIWSWIGICGWSIVRFLNRRSRWRFVLAALLLSMPMLIGEPMTLMQFWLLLLAGAFAYDRRALAPVLMLAAVSVLLCTVQFLPMIDHARDSIRAFGFKYSVVTDYSMPPLRPLELFTPHPFGIVDIDLHTFRGFKIFPRGLPYYLSIYCGLFSAVFACAGLFARIRGAAVFLGVAAASYILAIGSATPLYAMLYALGLHSIRYPEKFAAMGGVAMIVFAAISANRLLAGDAKVRIGAIAAAGMIAVAGLLAAIWIPAGRLGFLTTAALAAAWCLVTWKRAPVLLGLVLLLIDILPMANQIAPRMPHELFTPPPIARLLTRGATVAHRGEWFVEDQNFRSYERLSHAWLSRNGLRTFTANVWGLRSVLEPDIDETFLLPTHQLLDVFKQTGGTDQVIALTGADFLLDWRDFNVARREATSISQLQPLSIRKANVGGIYRSNAQILSVVETANTARIEVNAAVRSMLLMLVTRHKYWTVTIDRNPVTTKPANIAFQAVEIPPGHHTVMMQYRNPLILWGAAVSCVTLMLLLIIPMKPRNR